MPGRLSAWDRGFLAAAAVGAVLESICVVVNLVPGWAATTTPVVVALFVPVFPVFAYGLFKEIHQQSRHRLAQGGTWRQRATRPADGIDIVGALRRLPRILQIAVAAVAALLILAAATGLPRTKGQPTATVDHHYYADNHGEHIPLTRHQYQVQLSEWQRGFAGIPGVFYLVALLVILVPRSEPTLPTVRA